MDADSPEHSAECAQGIERRRESGGGRGLDDRFHHLRLRQAQVQRGLAELRDLLGKQRFRSHPLGNLHRFAGFDQVRAWEEEYLPAEELDKYADSVGHQPGRS